MSAATPITVRHSRSPFRIRLPTAFAAPELSVYINGPEKLQAGLSGTYNVSAAETITSGGSPSPMPSFPVLSSSP